MDGRGAREGFGLGRRIGVERCGESIGEGRCAEMQASGQVGGQFELERAGRRWQATRVGAGGPDRLGRCLPEHAPLFDKGDLVSFPRGVAPRSDGIGPFDAAEDDLEAMVRGGRVGGTAGDLDLDLSGDPSGLRAVCSAELACLERGGVRSVGVWREVEQDGRR